MFSQNVRTFYKTLHIKIGNYVTPFFVFILPSAIKTGLDHLLNGAALTQLNFQDKSAQGRNSPCLYYDSETHTINK